MKAEMLDGRAVSQAMLADVRSEVEEFVQTAGRRPVLATVLVGDDPASHTYVRMKVNRCREVGIESRRVDLSASIDTEELCRVIGALSADPEVDGILLQHPMPHHIDERAAFDAIDPSKDVDGVTLASFAGMSGPCPRNLDTGLDYAAVGRRGQGPR